MVACTKSEVKFEGETEIAFAPVSSVSTKAVGAIPSTTYPTDENFLVWAYWQDVPAGSDKNAFTDPTTYIDRKEFKNATNKLWKGKDRSYYWPKTGSMVFACVSPANAPFMDNVLPTHTLANEFKFNYANSNNTAETRDLLWANCAGSYNEAAAGANGVPVEFKHALAWITFRVKGEGAAQGAYTMTSLTLNQVNTGAHFKSAGNGSWESHMTPKNYEVFTGSKPLTGSLVDLETNPAGTLVIPQTQTADYTATLKYTNATGDNPINETIELKLGTAWEIGKHYIYEITFSPKEILIAPVVEDWVEVKMPIEY
jgi:hypothetical protein